MLANKNVTISDGEMEVMRVVWDAGKPVTSNEITDGLKHIGWKPSTILTLIRRLCEKEVLAVDKPEKQRNKSYIAVISERTYLKIQTHQFVDKVFMGSAKSLVATLFESDGVNEKDLREIKEWLENRGDSDAK